MAVVLAGYLFPFHGRAMSTIVAIALPVVMWALFRRSFNAPFMSPTFFLCTFLMLIAAVGHIFRRPLAEATGGASISIVLSDSDSQATLWLVSAFVTIILCTAGLAIRTMSPVPSGMKGLAGVAKEPHGAVLFVSLIPLVLLVVDTGQDLIQRNYYLTGDEGSLISSVGQHMATAAVLGLGFIFGASKGIKRSAAFFVALSYLMLFFSFGSRRFALVPVLFALGIYLATNSSMARRGIIVGAVLSFLLLPMPLAFRAQAFHGLSPYLELLPELSPFTSDWLSIVNNVLIAFPIIGATAFGAGEVYPSDLLVAINPMPGGAAGWYEISQRMMLNPYTPYAGVGELGAVGWWAVLVFGFGIGLVIAWLESSVRLNVNAGSHLYPAILLGISGLFALQLVQYTLRSGIRMLLYAVLIELARRALVVVTTKSRNENRPRTEFDRTYASLRRIVEKSKPIKA